MNRDSTNVNSHTRAALANIFTALDEERESTEIQVHAFENEKMCDKLYHTTKADGKEGTYFETTNTEGGGERNEKEKEKLH